MKPALSALALLRRTPHRFGFDAAMRVLTAWRAIADPAEAIHFRTPPGGAFPAAEILHVTDDDAAPPQVTIGLLGLTGPSGVLPRFYTEMVVTALRGRSHALHEFLDLLGHRMLAMFARAGVKYRLHRAAEIASQAGCANSDPVSQVLLALGGHGTPHLADRLEVGTEPLLHYAGLFATHPRSADRLGALVSDWLGYPVGVEQLVGTWLPIPPDQQTRLLGGNGKGTWNRLGMDAAIGARAWDVNSRIMLRIGPLDADTFDALLPRRPKLRRLVSLVRAFIGPELDFIINPVVARESVPAARLDRSGVPGPLLGWNTWLGGAVGRRTDAADALFAASMPE